MGYTVRTKGEHTIVAIDGEVDLYSVAGLRKEILKLIDDDISSLVIDMANLRYMDSSGIALMANLQKKMKANKGKDTFALLNVNGDIMEVLKLAALENFFIIYESEAQLK